MDTAYFRQMWLDSMKESALMGVFRKVDALVAIRKQPFFGECAQELPKMGEVRVKFRRLASEIEKTEIENSLLYPLKHLCYHLSSLNNDFTELL